jgi:hypothetical protein
MTPNRIVAILTPLVFAPVAGGIATWLAEHFPGAGVDEEQLTAIFIAGSLIALAPAVQWLNGWQKWEAREADAAREAELAEIESPAAVVIDEEPGLDEEFMDEAEFALDDEDLDDLAELEELEDIDEPEVADDELVPTGG